MSDNKPLLLLALAFIGLVLLANFTVERLTVDTVTGTVMEKYIKRYDETDYFHVVLQKTDGTKEILWNKDAFFWLKFNSADVQQTMEVGKTYKITVIGWRITLFSWFRNIVEVTATQRQ